MANDGAKTCFVISPIGEPDSDARRRSDQILRHVIGPACQSCGYTPVRADQISEPGIITAQIIQHITEDPLVIADLTDRNPNVFYELAVRHVLRKPYVQLIQRGERLPFDVAAVRTIEVDHHDLDSVEEAKSDIIRQIQSMEASGYEVQSPISVAIDLERLRQSSVPEQRQLADILDTLLELRSDMVNLRAMVRDDMRSAIMASGVHSRQDQMTLDRVERLRSLALQLDHSIASLGEEDPARALPDETLEIVKNILSDKTLMARDLVYYR